METPAGWYQVLRGPHPKSEHGPRRQPWVSSSWQSWGQWRAQEPQSPPVRRRVNSGKDPEEVQVAARHRVERLENALQALGETESTLAQGLYAALQEARRAAQGRPLAVQLKESQAFIERSQNRLRQMEEERVLEKKALDEGLARLSRLPRGSPVVTQPAQIPVAVPSAEVRQLKGWQRRSQNAMLWRTSALVLCR